MKIRLNQTVIARSHTSSMAGRSTGLPWEEIQDQGKDDKGDAPLPCDRKTLTASQSAGAGTNGVEAPLEEVATIELGQGFPQLSVQTDASLMFKHPQIRFSQYSIDRDDLDTILFPSRRISKYTILFVEKKEQDESDWDWHRRENLPFRYLHASIPFRSISNS